MLTIKKQYLFIIIKKQIFKMKKTYIFRLARAILAASSVSTALGADFLFAYNENTNEVVVMTDDDWRGFDTAEKKVKYLNEKLYPGWSYKEQEKLEEMTGDKVKKPFLMHPWYMVGKENIYEKLLSNASNNPAPDLIKGSPKFFKELRGKKEIYKFPQFWKETRFYHNPLTNEGFAVVDWLGRSMQNLGYEEVSMRSLIEGKNDPKKPLTVHWCVWADESGKMFRYPLYKGLEKSPQCPIDNYPEDYIQLSDKKPEKIEETEFGNTGSNDWFYIKEDDPSVVVASPSGSDHMSEYTYRKLNFDGFKKMSFLELLKDLQSKKKSVTVTHCVDKDKKIVPLWDKMKAGDTQCNIENYPKDFIKLPESLTTSFLKWEPDFFYKNLRDNTFIAVPGMEQDSKARNFLKEEMGDNGPLYQEFTLQNLEKELSKYESRTVTITQCVTMNESGQIDRQSLYQGMKPKDTPCNIEEYESNKQIALPKKN
jgi:hypothetical protein